ncbi:MAG: class I SAM-dependent methyltransferase [Candidatus Solibacter sp.]|jgi:ubiquinone/menaquinone biosynthesis C-methylase UbiE
MTFQPTVTEAATGELYGELWNHYDDALFRASVELFEKRWLANREPAEYFRGKRCLDAGCGGGRYSMALALMGAASVVGIDLGEDGLRDARLRQQRLGLTQVEFEQASVLNLPFPEGEFDFVCCSGVLHHTPGIERGLSELRRVLKPEGELYLLLYGAGGLFWPSVLLLRPLAKLIGRETLEKAVVTAGLPANRRRSLLDDYFVPLLETYTRERVEFLLRSSGFAAWRYWTDGRFDHESDASSMIGELEMRLAVWNAAAVGCADFRDASAAAAGAAILRDVVETARGLLFRHESGRISSAELREAVVGHGHHRLIARRA